MLLTLPVHADCNHDYQSDEDYFVASIGPLVHETYAGRALVTDARRRLARAPVSEYTVAKEMGHGGTSLVRRVYGHLGSVRHRSEVVEYRVEQHAEALETGLQLLTWAKTVQSNV